MKLSTSPTGATSPREPNPYAAGAEAFRRRKDAQEACPYVKGSREYAKWLRGYEAAQLEAIEQRILPDWVGADLK
jgi:hypothetical protein